VQLDRFGLYNRDEKCLQRSTDWDFKQSSLRLFYLQHKLIFYNRNEKCLQRGADWVFKWSGLRFVYKRLKDGAQTALFKDPVRTAM
jgi:hypothetical protein